MESTGFSTAEQAYGLVGELQAGAGAVRDGEFWKLGRDELCDLGREVERLARLVYAVQIRVVGELAAQDAAKQVGYSSTAAMIRPAFHLSGGDAAARVRAAKNLLPQDVPSGGEVPPVLPGLAAALDAGDVGPDHVRIVTQTMTSLPSGLHPQVREEAEQFLAEQARICEPAELDRLAEKLQNALNPDGDLPDDPADRAELRFGTRNHATGLTPISGKLDDVGVATIRKALDALAAPRPEAGGVKDPRPAATRNAHALVEAMSIFLKFGAGPTQGGVQPHLSVLIEWDVLNQAFTSATLDSGHHLSLHQVRLLACDAGVLPAVLGSRGQVLDVGRTSRTFPTAIRQAITIRDRGCVFPGCGRAAAWSDFHHISWWVRDLGGTSLHNGCLLCKYHHTLIHRGDWEIRIGEDGHPEVIPPRWIDPDRIPRRNTLHHI